MRLEVGYMILIKMVFRKFLAHQEFMDLHRGLIFLKNI